MDIQDKLLEKIDRLYDVSVQTLNELKRMGDITSTQINSLEKECQRLDHEIHEATDSRKNIYNRLEKLERTCAARHGGLNDRAPENVIAKWALSGWGIVGAAVLGALGMRIADRLF